MDGIREYLLGVCAAGILCATVSGMLGKNGMVSAAGKMLTGMFMLVTLLSPLMNLRLTPLDRLLGDVQQQADILAAQGENSARQALKDRIKERTEAYILDKARSYGASLSVSVTVSDDDLPVPRSVRLTGHISPYGKQQLTDVIRQDLGIPTEAQQWN